MQVYRQLPNWFRSYMTILIAGRHDHPPADLQVLGNGCAERERACDRKAYGYLCLHFNPERCFSLIGKSDQSAGKLRFDDSEHPFHRLCGTKRVKRPLVNLGLY